VIVVHSRCLQFLVGSGYSEVMLDLGQGKKRRSITWEYLSRELIATSRAACSPPARIKFTEVGDPISETHTPCALATTLPQPASSRSGAKSHTSANTKRRQATRPSHLVKTDSRDG
jgi:hypothetical protein